MGEHEDRLAVSVEKSQKEKWEDYVDKTDAYASVSDLVRKSVENELGLDDKNQELGELREDLLSVFESLNRNVNGIKQNVDQMEDRIPSEGLLYDINHDANLDSLDKVFEDTNVSTDYYRR